MENIVGVEFYIPSKDEADHIDFEKNGSLSDADIIVFRPPQNLPYYVLEDTRFEGREVVKPDHSFSITERYDHWKKEIFLAMGLGKIIFVLLEEKKEFYVHTGKAKTFGSGRTTSTKRIVDYRHNYQFLPDLKLDITNASGSRLFLQNNLFHKLDKCCSDFFKFNAYITSEEKIESPIYTTKNKDKVIGTMEKCEKGFVVFLPAIEFPKAFYTKAGYFTEAAYTWGKQFKISLSEVSKALKKSAQSTPEPDWVQMDKFDLSASRIAKQQINKCISEIAQIKQRLTVLENTLRESDSLKSLLYETGKPLEFAVIKALNILGYSAENFDDGKLELDQIIISPEGDRFIGECEGKDNKDVDISKLRQLMDSLNEDFARDEISEKAFGILFGNPQRLIDPQKRTLDFTEKCTRGAEREKIAMVKTSDLFKVCRHILESGDKVFQKQCRDAIKDQLGKLVEFPKLPESNLSITQEDIPS